MESNNWEKVMIRTIRTMIGSGVHRFCTFLNYHL